MEPVVQLPMPIPANYNYDPRQIGTENRRARDEYERAVEVWKEAVARFAATHRLPPTP